LQKWGWEVLHRPDLAPSTFYLLGQCKNILLGKGFEGQNAMKKKAVLHGKEHYWEGIFKCVEKRISV
jgi:hypothetical protein